MDMISKVLAETSAATDVARLRALHRATARQLAAIAAKEKGGKSGKPGGLRAGAAGAGKGKKKRIIKKDGELFEVDIDNDIDSDIDQDVQVRDYYQDATIR